MKNVFIISMGHFINTPGKRANGFFEWEFNRDVGHRLYKLLSPHGIIHFVVDGVLSAFDEMTKEGRIANLKYRCDNANEIEKYYQELYGKENIRVIFIAIHANAADDPAASGYGIHIYSLAEERYEIAKMVHKAAKEILGVGAEIKDRGIIEHPVFVNKNTNMPSILIEHEFFTNLEAVKKLKDSDFRQKCAQHIAVGLGYYCGFEVETTRKSNIIKSFFEILAKSLLRKKVN